MRIKKKNIGEDLNKAKEYAKNSVEALKNSIEPVSQEIQQGIEDITGNPDTAKKISDEMAASAIDKAYSESGKVDEAVNGKHTVEYRSERTDETPFIINGIKWQYVNAIYPDGKRDIGVYRFDHDLTYDFKWFMDEVIPKPDNYDVVDEVAVSDGIDEASDEHAVSVDATHDMGIIQNIIRSVDNLSQIPVLKNLVDNFKVKHNSEPELGNLVDTLNNQINSVMRQSESDDGDASRAIQYGQQQGEVGDSEYDEYQTLLRSLAADSKKIENGDDEEPMNDLPFESVKPKMTKNELIESVLNNTSKKRKVIKTISVKNLRNE
jgi:hypothetical protein|tara:strand:- start:406 stop:1368 length:963 start_codon:yes stop_codon:yes gene_type:complete